MSLVKKKGVDEGPRYCDYYIHDYDYPLALRYWLLVNRVPASDRSVLVEKHGEPVCFADHEGKRVRLVMASRFGDVGITSNLQAENGYEQRVMLQALSNFSEFSEMEGSRRRVDEDHPIDYTRLDPGNACNGERARARRLRQMERLRQKAST